MKSLSIMAQTWSFLELRLDSVLELRGSILGAQMFSMKPLKRVLKIDIHGLFLRFTYFGLLINREQKMRCDMKSSLPEVSLLPGCKVPET